MKARVVVAQRTDWQDINKEGTWSRTDDEPFDGLINDIDKLVIFLLNIVAVSHLKNNSPSCPNLWAQIM